MIYVTLASIYIKTRTLVGSQARVIHDELCSAYSDVENMV